VGPWAEPEPWGQERVPTKVYMAGTACRSSRTIDGRTDEIADPCNALTGIDEVDEELTLICGRDRVVLWHGLKHQTWVARQGAWTRVAGGGPPRGTGVGVNDVEGGGVPEIFT
jgi:hypothetical protein